MAKADQWGEIAVLVGVVVVGISLIPFVSAVELPIAGELFAWLGVGVIVIGEAILLRS